MTKVRPARWAVALLALAIPASLVAAAPMLLHQRELARDLRGVDRIEVRHSGGRFSDGRGYCPCMPGQRGLIFETRNRADILEVSAALTLGWHWDAVSCECCGRLTLEFYRGPSLAASVNFHSLDQARFYGKCWGDIPLSSRGQHRLAAWLAGKGLTLR